MKIPVIENILDVSAFKDKGVEQFRTLLASGGIEIEQIASFGHVTPCDRWYDQDWDEWVMVVGGQAKICFDNGEPGPGNAPMELLLGRGDCIFIEKHMRHKVCYTSEDCVWLAVHLRDCIKGDSGE